MMQVNLKSRGFTLVELAVVMVVAAILVAIAIPGYTSYMRKARRTDAKAALLGLAALEERSDIFVAERLQQGAKVSHRDHLVASYVDTA